MKLNRRQRRKNRGARPNPLMTPQQQFAAFLKAPGKIYAVELPDEKQFLVKVTEPEMNLFTTMCAQLRAVLGHCEARGMTPVEAHVADHAEVAMSSAESTKRIREARQRSAEAEEHVYKAEAELAAARQGCECPPDPMGFDCSHEEAARVDEVAAARQRRETGTMPADPSGPDGSLERHPAGKRRGGKHRAPEPTSTFDLLASGADNEDGERQLVAMELAAAQDAVRDQTDRLNQANERYAAVAERAAKLNNERVLENWADAASRAVEHYGVSGGPGGEEGVQIENDGLTPFKPQWQMSEGKPLVDDAGIVTAQCLGCGAPRTADHVCGRNKPTIPDGEPQHYGIDWKGPNDPTPFPEPVITQGTGPAIEQLPGHTYRCPLCTAEFIAADKGQIARMYANHVATAHKPVTDATNT